MPVTGVYTEAELYTMINTLVTLCNELKTDLDALRVDYITHDHGAADTYATATLRSAASGGSTDTGATSTAIAAADASALDIPSGG